MIVSIFARAFFSITPPQALTTYFLRATGACYLRAIAARAGDVLRWLLLLALVALSACSSSSYTPNAVEERPDSGLIAVGAVTMRYAPTADPAVLPLDIAISVFDQGLNNTQAGERVFPTVRKAESLLIPTLMAATLKDSGAWGVVRVVQSTDTHMPLRIEGEILRSDGEVLELQLRVIAADGRQVLARAYRDDAQPGDYPVTSGGEPFADMYRAISNDLLALNQALTRERRQELQRLSMLRFANDLAPATFARFVERDASGIWGVVSYPADDDPMLARLTRIRRQDELFIDTVDEQYADLYRQVADSYALWREYSFELQRYGDNYRASAAERKRNARRGSYAAMQQVYGTFRKVKIQEEDLREVVKGFAGESLETVLEVDDGVFRLSGSVEQRYAEWRQILGRIYGLETGELPDARN